MDISLEQAFQQFIKMNEADELRPDSIRNLRNRVKNIVNAHRGKLVS